MKLILTAEQTIDSPIIEGVMNYEVVNAKNFVVQGIYERLTAEHKEDIIRDFLYEKIVLYKDPVINLFKVSLEIET